MYCDDMRMAELSDASGLPPATIKWYLKEGLLSRGKSTARNQAQYSEAHVRRLRLIRALVDAGGLAVSDVRAILAVLDDETADTAEVVAAAHGALSRRPGPVDPAAMAFANAFIEHRRWTVTDDSPARVDLASTIAALNELSPMHEVALPATQAEINASLDPYADAVEALAANEIDMLPEGVPREVVVEQVVLGTVLLENALGALRRLAQENAFLGRMET
jgi:DNA-binding transcriptional MerR regulator